MLNDVIRTLSFLQPRADDDFVDQLHYYYTTTFLIILSVLVSFKMFGRPMECWIPAEYPKHWADFAEMYCWAQNTYWLPFEEDLASQREDTSNHRQISYYQWVPFFLLFQAMFFYAPCLIWRFFNVRSGVIMEDILAVARDHQNIHPEVRQRNIEALAVHLESVFDHRFKLSSKMESSENSGLYRYCNMRYFDGYMTTLYIIVKTLYLINVTGQLFLMNVFLQTSSSENGGYTFYGAGVLMDLLRGTPWQTSGYFPRITMCDMQIRTLANVQRHTVQCVLALNIFNEKIFILLWFLYSMLLACTICNLLFWIFESFNLEARTRFLLRHLELAGLGYACTYKRKERAGRGRWWRRFSKDSIGKNGYTKSQRRVSSPSDWLTAAAQTRLDNRLSAFSREFVKLDGAFVLRMLTAHAGVMFSAELVEALWQLYDDRSEMQKREMQKYDAYLSDPIFTEPGLDVKGQESPFGVDSRRATVIHEEEEEQGDDKWKEGDTAGKGSGVYFAPSPTEAKPPPVAKLQRRPSIMTLSSRQSMQQRRLSLRRMNTARRSSSASQLPSYV